MKMKRGICSRSDPRELDIHSVWGSPLLFTYCSLRSTELSSFKNEVELTGVRFTLEFAHTMASVLGKARRLQEPD